MGHERAITARYGNAPHGCGKNSSQLRFGGLLFGSRALLLDSGIAAGKLFLELLDASGRVDVLQLARIERVAGAANIDLQLGPRRPSLKGIAATAFHSRFDLLWVDVGLHRTSRGIR